MQIGHLQGECQCQPKSKNGILHQIPPYTHWHIHPTSRHFFPNQPTQFICIPFHSFHLLAIWPLINYVFIPLAIQGREGNVSPCAIHSPSLHKLYVSIPPTPPKCQCQFQPPTTILFLHIFAKLLRLPPLLNFDIFLSSANFFFIGIFSIHPPYFFVVIHVGTGQTGVALLCQTSFPNIFSQSIKMPIARDNMSFTTTKNAILNPHHWCQCQNAIGAPNSLLILHASIPFSTTQQRQFSPCPSSPFILLCAQKQQLPWIWHWHWHIPPIHPFIPCGQQNKTIHAILLSCCHNILFMEDHPLQFFIEDLGGKFKHIPNFILDNDVFVH